MPCTLTQFNWITRTHCTNTTYLLSLDTIQCTSTTLHIVRKDPARTIQWRQSFRGWRALRVTVFPFHDTTRTLKWNTFSYYIFYLVISSDSIKWKGFNDICASLKQERKIGYSYQLFLILYSSRHRETISLRGPVFHRSHGHNLVRPGHQSEVNYDYVSKICRKFTRTQSETSITLMGHPQNSSSIVYFSKGFWPLSDMLADQYTTLVIALDWPNLCLK